MKFLNKNVNYFVYVFNGESVMMKICLFTVEFLEKTNNIFFYYNNYNVDKILLTIFL